LYFVSVERSKWCPYCSCAALRGRAAQWPLQGGRGTRGRAHQTLVTARSDSGKCCQQMAVSYYI